MARHIEMKMIAMKPVRIRAKHRAKGPAGARVERAQDTPAPARAPIAQHGQFAPIGQSDAGDIDGVAPTVF